MRNPRQRRLLFAGLCSCLLAASSGIAPAQNKPPTGDPIELLVRGASLSIRRAEARVLEVTFAGAAPSIAKSTPAIEDLENVADAAE